MNACGYARIGEECNYFNDEKLAHRNLKCFQVFPERVHFIGILFMGQKWAVLEYFKPPYGDQKNVTLRNYAGAQISEVITEVQQIRTGNAPQNDGIIDEK